jgi:hypothetical protein
MPFDPIRPLKLAHGVAFADLYSADGASKVDSLFIAHLEAADAGLASRIAAARANPDALPRKDESSLLIALGPHVEDFLGALFGIEGEVQALEARHHELAPLYAVKRQFVQRKAMNTHRADAAAAFDGAALRRDLEQALGGAFTELGFAEAVTKWQQEDTADAAALDVALRYAAWASHTPEGRAAHKGGVLFRAPRKLDYMNLVPLELTHVNGVDAWKIPDGHERRREGFALTDPGMNLASALDPVALLHLVPRAGQRFLRARASREAARRAPPPDNPFKKSLFGVTLAGCP